MTTLTVTPTERREQYDRDGVVQVEGLLDAVEIATIRKAYMEQVERDRTGVGVVDDLGEDDILSRYPRLVQPHRRPDLAVGVLARRYLVDPRIVDVVTELVGPVWGAQSMFYFKPPTARGQAMHQDNYFLRAHPETCIAAWIAIDDCDQRTVASPSCLARTAMEVVCPEEADSEESFSEQSRAAFSEGMESVQSVMRAGDVLFFHGSVVHGSLPEHFLRPVPALSDPALRAAGQHRGVPVLLAARRPGHRRRRRDQRGHRRRTVRRELGGRRALTPGRTTGGPRETLPSWVR